MVVITLTHLIAVQLYWHIHILVQNVAKWLKHKLQIELCEQEYDNQIFRS
jgi:hypothetical protein